MSLLGTKCCPLLTVVATLSKTENKLETLMGVKIVCFHFNLTEGLGLCDITTCLEANLGQVCKLHKSELETVNLQGTNTEQKTETQDRSGDHKPEVDEVVCKGTEVKVAQLQCKNTQSKSTHVKQPITEYYQNFNYWCINVFITLMFQLLKLELISTT